MHEVKAIVRPGRLEPVLHALHEMPDLPGVTVSEIQGIGRRTDAAPPDIKYGDVRMTKLEIVVPDALLARVLTVIEAKGRTGRPDDGRIFVLPVSDARRIRTGDRNEAAL